MKIGSDDSSPGVGHNSDTILNGDGQTQVRSIVERIERLNEEKGEIAEQIKEVYAEAKGNGFDVPILRLMIRKRQIDKAKGQERMAILELYCHAIGEPELAELI